MDLFKRLPVELIWIVLHHLSDFASLENLMATSPYVKDVFRGDHRAILERTITSNPITTTDQIRNIYREIAFIRSRSFRCAKLERYKRQLQRDPSAPILPRRGLHDSNLSLRLLRIASQIQRLACICLSRLRQNFITAVSDPDNPMFSPAQVQTASAPFSWTEEYRVYWSLWHLWRYSDLRKAAITSHWPSEFLAELDMYASWIQADFPQAEQFWTVSAVLAGLGMASNYDTGAYSSEDMASRHPEQVPIPLFASFKLPRTVGKGARPLWGPPPLLFSMKLSRTELFEILFSYLALISRLLNQIQLSQLRLVDFRSYGVLLWDKRRMAYDSPDTKSQPRMVSWLEWMEEF